MKILQLNFEKGWRGGERQTLYCMRAFRKAGHEVELMCRLGGRWPSARAGRIHRPRMPQRAGAAAFLAGAGRYDIIHAQTANTVTWAVLTKWLHRRPVAFSRRTSFVVKPNEEWKTGFKWRHVDLFVAISEMAASERRLGIEPAIIRSAVEPHAINADNVAALVSEFQLDGRKVMATSAALIRTRTRSRWCAPSPSWRARAATSSFCTLAPAAPEQAARTRPASWASRTSTASPAFARAWKTSTACWTCSS